jgi:hypothetical protein
MTKKNLFSSLDDDVAAPVHDSSRVLIVVDASMSIDESRKEMAETGQENRDKCNRQVWLVSLGHFMLVFAERDFSVHNAQVSSEKKLGRCQECQSQFEAGPRVTSHLSASNTQYVVPSDVQSTN